MKSPRGRRPGQSDTRETILAAAQRQFAELGYDRASMRSIAREAGVDLKLVGYFFGSKQQLFLAAAAPRLPANVGQALPKVLSGSRRGHPPRARPASPRRGAVVRHRSGASSTKPFRTNFGAWGSSARQSPWSAPMQSGTRGRSGCARSALVPL
jgi:hypothetical protein